MGALVCLAGMMCDERLFAPLQGRLPQISQMIIPDLSKHDNWHCLADAVLEQAPPQFGVLGVSFGAALALELCARAPERITHLIFMDGNPNADTPEKREGRLALVAFLNQHGLRELMWQKQFPHYLAQSNTNDAVIELCWQMAETLGADVFRTQTAALLSRTSRLAELHAFKAPALMLRGAEDRVCPAAYHTELANALPQADYYEIGAAGHLPVLEQPEKTIKEINTWMTQLAKVH